MFNVIVTEKGGEQKRLEFDKPEVTIGRVQGNDIILPKGNVSKRHSRIVLKDDKFIIVDLKSTNGTYVNGRKITSPMVIKGTDKIYIGDFILTIEELGSRRGRRSAARGGLSAGALPRARRPRRPLTGPPRRTGPPPPPPKRPTGSMPVSGTAPPPPPRPAPEPEGPETLPPSPAPPPAYPPPMTPATAPPMAPPQYAPPVAPPPQYAPPTPPPPAPPRARPREAAGRGPAGPRGARAAAAPDSAPERRPALRRRPQAPETGRAAEGHPRPAHRVPRPAPPGHRQARRRGAVGQDREGHPRHHRADGRGRRASRRSSISDALLTDVLNEALGLGPLEDLLADDDDHRDHGQPRRPDLHRAQRQASSLPTRPSPRDEAVLAVIERIVAPLGRRIDESSPLVDARLKDGSRVNAIIPPLALKGPCLTIRKFSKRDAHASRT